MRDSTIPFMRSPYEFISQEAFSRGSDVFETRLLLQKTICMVGAEAAKIFYDEDRFIRKGAAPSPIASVLFGKGGVQSLDDEAHLHRKRMIMSLMTPERVEELGELTRYWLKTYAELWQFPESIRLYEEMQEILTRAVCDWVGIPLEESEVKLRTRQLTALFDQVGNRGPAHLRAKLKRGEANRWIEDLVRDYRYGRFIPRSGSPFQVITQHYDHRGRLLTPRVAAVEILSLLRPTVAVSLFVVFSAHALHQRPDCHERILLDDENFLENFVQEVRRFYPFFPAVPAVVRKDFVWRGQDFTKGTRVLLDLYGTNHDPRVWEAPQEFRPERFEKVPAPYSFIPQGSGDYYLSHRCPGEFITLEIMKTAVHFLVKEITYFVPEQDLRINLSRLPAAPEDHFTMSYIKKLRTGVNLDSDQGRIGTDRFDSFFHL